MVYQRSKQPAVCIVLIMLISLAFATGGQAANAAARTASGPTCPDVYFIGSMGSGENNVSQASYNAFHGMGPEVWALFTQLEKALPSSEIVQPAANVYPAGDTKLLYNFAHTPTTYAKNINKWFAGLATGKSNVIKMVNSEIAACPATQIVLAGYSQGAMATHQAENALGGTTAAHIAATILLADGDRVPNTIAKHYGSSPSQAIGIETTFARLHLRPAITDVPFSGTTTDICDVGDLVCDFGTSFLAGPAALAHGIAVHTSYVTTNKAGTTLTGWQNPLTQGAKFAASKVLLPSLRVSPKTSWIPLTHCPDLNAPTTVTLTGRRFSPGEGYSFEIGGNGYLGIGLNADSTGNITQTVSTPPDPGGTVDVDIQGLYHTAYSTLNTGTDSCLSWSGNLMEWSGEGWGSQDTVSFSIDGATVGSAVTDDFGSFDSGPLNPCPSSGTHNYVFDEGGWTLSGTVSCTANSTAATRAAGLGTSPTVPLALTGVRNHIGTAPSPVG